jgi:hypothetical protein
MLKLTVLETEVSWVAIHLILLYLYFIWLLISVCPVIRYLLK